MVDPQNGKVVEERRKPLVSFTVGRRTYTLGGSAKSIMFWLGFFLFVGPAVGTCFHVIGFDFRSIPREQMRTLFKNDTMQMENQKAMRNELNAIKDYVGTSAREDSAQTDIQCQMLRQMQNRPAVMPTICRGR